MANTYTQIHIQFVFAVKYRTATIHSSWKVELYKYITVIIQHHKHKLIAINGMADHIHILVGMRPTQSTSDLMQDVKASSSKWINEKQLAQGRFEWQEGYGAFSYGKSQLKDVVAYIINQEQRHSIKPFDCEVKEFMKIYGWKIS